ncbi:MAG: VWA domain-containing protein [Candidatus Dormibacteraeota bacterium]|nr:VWA domain-containing protein [Candidatus Dormibacteraeota bacterium]
MSLLVPLAALALLALPAIALLYFLKVKRPEVRVATLMFWRPYLADRQANAPWQRLRFSLLLLLQLLAALALAVGLMRPGLVGAAGSAKTTIVMVDASPTMEATDVKPSRFGAALQKTQQMADQMTPGQTLAVILAGPQAELLTAPTDDPAVIRSALARAQPAGSPGDFGQAMSLADSLVQGRPGASIMLIGDGHMKLPSSPPPAKASFTYVPVGNTGENAGIASISQPNQGSIFMELANYGRSARDLKVEMRADGRLADVVPVHLDGNTTTDVTWNRLPAGTGVVQATLTPADAFPLDDQAWLVTATPPGHKVLLVTAQNGFMQQALKLRPGVAVTTVKPQDYKPGGAYDLYVFDGWLPPGQLPEPSILIAPSSVPGSLSLGQQINPGAVLPSNPREPLLQDVSLQDVHVQSAASVKDPGDWRAIISAASTPLVLVHDGDPRSVLFTFDLHHSDLPLRSAFPILVQNLLGYVLPGAFENQAFSPGQQVNLQPEPGAKSMDVTTPDGNTIHLVPPFSPFTQTSSVGVYTVHQQLAKSTRLSRFVVQLQDPAISRIQPGAAPLVQGGSQPLGPLPRGTLELWPWLVGAGLALLALEWVLYLRGRLSR